MNKSLLKSIYCGKHKVTYWITGKCPKCENIRIRKEIDAVKKEKAEMRRQYKQNISNKKTNGKRKRNKRINI